MGDAIDVQWKSFLLRTEWASEAGPPSSSFPAQMAWKASAHFGDDAQQRYHHALLDAYFVQNRNISDGPELATIASECGIDKDAFVEFFTENHDQLRDQVALEHNSAISRGINAVPSVVINGTFPVPGAQDVETYERMISRIIDRV